MATAHVKYTFDQCPHIELIVIAKTERKCNDMFYATAFNSYIRDYPNLRIKWSLQNAKIVKSIGAGMIELKTKKRQKQPIIIKVEAIGLNNWPTGCPTYEIKTVVPCQ